MLIIRLHIHDQLYDHVSNHICTLKKKKKKIVCPHIFIFCHDVFTLHFILLSIISISIYLHVSNSEKIDWHPFMLINPPQLY